MRRLINHEGTKNTKESFSSWLRGSIVFELVGLVVVLALAVWLRFGWEGVRSFAWDEANISLDALGTARGGAFALAGQASSVGIPFFPASVYAFVPPYLLSPDPLVANLYVSLISLLMVIGVWALARSAFGPVVGLAAALYLAVSPFAVLYGRSIWQPNLLGPLALAWLASAYMAVVSTRRRDVGVALCVFVGLLTPQVHFAGIALVVATAYPVMRWRWWRRPLPLLIGAGLAAIPALPYLYYVTAVDPGVLERFRGTLGGTAQIDANAMDNLLRIALNYDWSHLGLGSADPYSRGIATAAVTGVVLVLGVVAVGRVITQPLTPQPPLPRRRGEGELGTPQTQGIMAFLADRSALSHTPTLNYSELDEVDDTFTPSPRLRGRGGWGVRGKVLSELTLVLLVVSPLVFLRHSTPVLVHYQLIALPALALIAGAATGLFKHPLWKAAVMVVLIGLLAVWTGQIAGTLNSASVTRVPDSALSTLLRESRDAVLSIPSDRPLLFFTHGDDTDLNGEAAVFKSLLWDRPHRIIDGRYLLILPPTSATLMATLRPFQAWEEIEASGLALDMQEYPRREGALPFVVTSYEGSEPEGFSSLDPVAFADGTTLIGWRARRMADRWRVSTLWQAGEVQLTATVQQFHHLRTADAPDSDPLMVSDVPLTLGAWRSGDRVIVMADFFDVPPGEYTLDIGHYTLPDVLRIPRIDGGDSVRLGTFTVGE
jgi:hypothetical protein